MKTTKDSVAVHAAETKESSKNKSLLYARFVKGATLKASEGIIVEEPEKSSESESEKEQIPPRLTDEEILKICGGRTAHKAAGHGLKQNGKLQRIQEQERQYLESLNKKADIISNSPISDPKRGKKHKRVTKEQDILMEGMNCQEEEMSRKKRKKESKEELQTKNTTELAESTKIKKKKKKKCKEKREQNKKQEKDKKNCVTEDETSISNKGEKKKRKKEYLEVNKEREEANDVEIIEKKKQYEMEEYDETEQEFKEMTKKKNKHRVKTEQLEKVVSLGKKKKRKHEEEEEIEYAKENPSLNQPLNKTEQEEKGDERKKKSKKKKKKEHKKKKQETEKSLIENEDSHIKIGDLSDKIEGEINENAFKQEPMKVDSCQKKVRFSLELVTVFTISDEENETHVQASKKKKKKHQTFD